MMIYARVVVVVVVVVYTQVIDIPKDDISARPSDIGPVRML